MRHYRRTIRPGTSMAIDMFLKQLVNSARFLDLQPLLQGRHYEWKARRPRY